MPVHEPMFVLLGIVILIVGFLARQNPLMVVVVAGLATALLGGMDLHAAISALGKAFNNSRQVSLIWLVLPVIGLLEREGLQERAKDLVARLRAATTGRILVAYFLVRQGTAALGLTSMFGHAQTVRPLVAPMAEAAAETRFETLPEKTRFSIRAWAASADNVAVFFGEDIFIAFGSILLIRAFLEQNGIAAEPLQLSVWAIPTAVCAFVIHCTRLLLLDRRLNRELGRTAETAEAAQ